MDYQNILFLHDLNAEQRVKNRVALTGAEWKEARFKNGSREWHSPVMREKRRSFRMAVENGIHQ